MKYLHKKTLKAIYQDHVVQSLMYIRLVLKILWHILKSHFITSYEIRFREDVILISPSKWMKTQMKKRAYFKDISSIKITQNYQKNITK